MGRRNALKTLGGGLVISILMSGRGTLAESSGVERDLDSYDWYAELSRLPGIQMSGSEKIAMLMYPGFTALDLIGPYHFLATMMGAEIYLVTNQPSLAPVKSDFGIAIQPTVTIADCPRDINILFAPGGTAGTVAAANDERTLDFMHDRALRAEFVTSVCTGSLILGAIGALRGKKATSHWSVRHLLGQFGAIPTHARVVQDGNVITGAGVSAGLDFGAGLVGRLRGEAYAQSSMLTAEYNPEPPFRGGAYEATPPLVARPIKAMFEEFVSEAKQIEVRR
ncbi:thiamine biosynthesis protein ThiJ [Mesorhizobium hungaricum]|uniref:Thiamine biosynthesis protein ThiJ n=2 Tax=Phyllobacteriaceae TaxID=69277 RepID=A0A1C2DP86_9HYPH|nr:thiamine biosynthesis protein ThiJ [Mesorhizobium hungaricum]